VLNSAGSTSTVFQFTGEQLDGSGMVYLRARYYAPHLNQWVQSDPAAPDPYMPIDWNPYVYVRANPINYTDPSGNQICLEPECLSSIENYNLTGWLVRALNANAASPEVRHIRDLNDLAGSVLPNVLQAVWETLWEKHIQDIDLNCLYTKLLENPYRAQAYDSWESLVRGGARWDFKRQINNQLGIDGVRLCHGSNECRWYDSDVPGNIHYGYVGKAAGFLGIELYIGAGKAQQEGTDPGSGRLWAYGDDPLDSIAIKVGIDLYRKSKSATVESFRSNLFKYRFNLRPGQEPPYPMYHAPFPIDPGLGPRFPVTYFDGG
jgi:RHS repeat-associated protein